MKSLENLRYELSFNSIYSILKNQKIDSEQIFKVRVNDARNFFGEVINGLGSIASEGEYHFVENLGEIVNAFGYSDISRGNINKIINKFKKTVNQLDSLEKNPEKFYKTKDSKELAYLCKELKGIYSEKINILECEEF